MDHDLGAKLKSTKKFSGVLVIHENFLLYGISKNCQDGVKVDCKKICLGAITSLVHRPHIVLLAL